MGAMQRLALETAAQGRAPPERKEVAEEGFEHQQESSEKRSTGDQSAAESAAVDVSLKRLRDIADDCDLLRVIDAWPSLNDYSRAEILSLIELSKQPLPPPIPRIPKQEGGER